MMSEPQPTPQLRAVDVTTGHGVVAAKIVDGAVEAHRAAVILDTVRMAIDEYAGDLRFVVLDFGDVDFINSSGVAAMLELASVVRQKTNVTRTTFQTLAWTDADMSSGTSGSHGPNRNITNNTHGVRLPVRAEIAAAFSSAASSTCSADDVSFLSRRWRIAWTTPHTV